MVGLRKLLHVLVLLTKTTRNQREMEIKRLIWKLDAIIYIQIN